MNIDIDDQVMVALLDLGEVDHVPVGQRVDAILRHYLTDLHSRLAPAAASVAAAVAGDGVHRETLEGPPVWPCVLCGADAGEPCTDHVWQPVRIEDAATAFEQTMRRITETVGVRAADLEAMHAAAAEHAVDHRDDPTTSGFSTLPEDPKTGSEEVDPLACTDCGFIAKAPQGLSAHIRKRHRCAACKAPVVTPTLVPGLGNCCRRCARDAT